MVGVLFSVTSGAVIGGWAGGVAEVVQDVVLGVGGLQLGLPPAGGLGPCAWGGAASLRAGGDVGGPGEQAQDQPHQDDQAHQQQAGHNQHPRTATGEGLLGEGPQEGLGLWLSLEETYWCLAGGRYTNLRVHSPTSHYLLIKGLDTPSNSNSKD